jgi:hypothetical protein
MPPVQPSPTMTTSTSLSFGAMAFSVPSAHVGNADGIGGVFLVANFSTFC